MSVSQNGWVVLESESECMTRSIAGFIIPLAPGTAGRVLAEFARKFHREVEPLNAVRDDWGWSYRRIGGSSEWSNHASGTALDLNSLRHPQGDRDTFRPGQLLRLRTLLAAYPVIKWGGDYRSTVDEMHFELAVSRTVLLTWVRSR